MRPLFLATAIPYVNARPHLGFAFELVLADALARHARARGRPVWLTTGTDEHALKNVTAARGAGVPIEAWVARHAKHFRDLAAAFAVSHDDFVRTSAEPRHAVAVEALWRACAAAGDLEPRSYRGSYCEGCERFVEPAEIAAGRCAEHAGPLEEVEEVNWFFRLSRHRDVLCDLVASGRLEVAPAAARAEILAFLRGEVRDVSLSRPAARAGGWGLPVPGDPTQVVYVWFDALAYYLTSVGWDAASPAPRYQRFWRDGETTHVVGKGISRFHAVLWPALLLSAGLPLPARVLVHGYLTVDGQKISKSGNTVDPLPILDEVGLDALRWYLLAHLRPTRDGDFRRELLVAAHDADLAGGFGNLAQRVTALCARAGGWPTTARDVDGDAALRAAAAALPARVDAAFARFAPDEAAAELSALARAADRHLVAVEPWRLLRGDAADRDRAASALAALVDVLRVLAAELAPFIPAGAAALAARLAAPPAALAPLFPRLAPQPHARV